MQRGIPCGATVVTDHVYQPLLHSVGVDERQDVTDGEIHSEGGRLEVPLLLAAVHKGDGDSFHLD